MEVVEEVEQEFGYVEMQVASLPDLFAGKICATLDRQHPRYLFDVKFLLENEGLTENLRKTFLYLFDKPSKTDVRTIRAKSQRHQ
jgi:predicted nucleotidyltransferase component of viral defense system